MWRTIYQGKRKLEKKDTKEEETTVMDLSFPKFVYIGIRDRSVL